jgi:hypothetical protein
MKITVATVLTSRPPIYAPDGSGVVLIRLSTPKAKDARHEDGSPLDVSAR